MKECILINHGIEAKIEDSFLFALESVLNVIVLNKAEIRSKLTRVSWAEGLISQLPQDHEGRNSWLLNYGTKEESQNLRKKKNLEFDEITQSCELVG